MGQGLGQGTLGRHTQPTLSPTPAASPGPQTFQELPEYQVDPPWLTSAHWVSQGVPFCAHFSPERSELGREGSPCPPEPPLP